MSDAPLETVPEGETPLAAPASKPPVDVDALVKAAREDAERKAQSTKDRELAQMHKTYQAREREIREQATGRMKQLGDTQAEDWDQQVQDRRDAQQYREIQAQAQTYQQQVDAWNQYAAGVASAHGLEQSDPRLSGAKNDVDLLERARKAMAADAEIERKRLLTSAQDANRTAVDRKVAAGELDTLNGGGAPAAPSGIADQYKKEMLAARGKGVTAGRAIREKYRAKGLDVDSVSLSG